MTTLALDIRCTLSAFTLQLACELPLSGATAIYGPSGSGKTTLLECIAGLRRAQSGSKILFNQQVWQSGDKTLPCWQRDIGFVFQDARLFPHLSVKQNLLYAQQRSRKSTLTLARVSQWMELEELLQRSPAELSGGQKQRVAIGRALLSGPQLLLLDEPLANLDSAARNRCLQALRSIQEELALPMLYVSHDIEEICQLAEHIIVLDRGTLREQGPLLAITSRLDTQLAHQERAAAVALGCISHHDETFGLTALDVEGQTLWVNHLPCEPGSMRRIRIPARDVSVCRNLPEASSILNILAVTLVEIETSGNAQVLLRLQLGEQFMLARITRKSASELDLNLGDRLYAQIKSAALLTEPQDLN
ncbi:MAG: molybdate transport system ATP-binding protein [Halieaceae bacterium]|jgi:molybdate transport system ATP-binding protein